MNRIDLKLDRGPFQNNGASPWFSNIPVGSAGQVLKFNLDTGVNYNWITSTLCAPERCVHYGGSRFDHQRSTTLECSRASDKAVDFGPWGEMRVAVGSDELLLPNGEALRVGLYLSRDYVGKNFAELDWDGGIGLPCGTEFVEKDSSLIVQQLLENGVLEPTKHAVSLTFDTNDEFPICRIGEPGNLISNDQAHVFIEWDRYIAAGPKYGYVWSGKLEELRIGSNIVAKDIHLCLDTGSSGLKGDPEIMAKLLSVASVHNESVVLQIGKTITGAAGLIELSSDTYKVKIEAGEDKDDVVPQFFTDVPMPKLLLIGSVLLDQVVAEFEYRVEMSGSSIRLHPSGVHLYGARASSPLRA